MDGKSSIPAHVAIIMDGNGRWAKRRLMPRKAGHNAGMNALVKITRAAKNLGLKYLTVYALSTENLARPKEELDSLFDIFRKYFSEKLDELYANNARIKVIGSRENLPQDICELIKKGEENSPKNYDLTFIIAMNYGGRQEIVNAADRAVERGEKLTEESFSKLLYTGDIPDPDLIIRTGGELRLSNFLLWQAAYAELYFTDVLFPDFDEEELKKALQAYSKRTRRFGKV